MLAVMDRKNGRKMELEQGLEKVTVAPQSSPGPPMGASPHHTGKAEAPHRLPVTVRLQSQPTPATPGMETKPHAPLPRLPMTRRHADHIIPPPSSSSSTLGPWDPLIRPVRS